MTTFEFDRECVMMMIVAVGVFFTALLMAGGSVAHAADPVAAEHELARSHGPLPERSQARIGTLLERPRARDDPSGWVGIRDRRVQRVAGNLKEHQLGNLASGSVPDHRRVRERGGQAAAGLGRSDNITGIGPRETL